MKYKETGIEWLGKVPEHWKVDRIKDKTINVVGGDWGSDPESEGIGDNIVVLRVSDLDDIYFSYENLTIRKIKVGSIKNRKINKNCLVIEKSGGGEKQLVGRVGYPKGLNFDAISSNFMAKIEFDNSVDLRFVNYMFYSLYDSRLNFPFVQQTTGIQNLNVGYYLNTIVVFPPKGEQIAIADYLDKACERIDKIIKIKEEQLLKMEANKHSLIKEFVTGKKTHKTHNEYLSSNIEWLGDIPKSWKLRRLFNISHFVRGNSSFKKDELLEEGKYVALQYGKTYKVEEVNEKFKFFVNDDFYKSSQIVNFGDVIFVSTSETLEDLGHSVFYNRNDIGLIGGEQILIKPKNTIIDGKYLFYTTKVFGKELRKFATGLKVFRFDSYDLKNIYVPVPPLKEQRAIAEHLDNSIEKTKKIKIIIQNQIKTLKNYRKSLIHEYVTGKKLVM